MTNEQAIKWIKQIQKVGYQDNLLNHKESLDMAIEALEQKPFMYKPCVAHQICHEDKVKVLDKIRAEIMLKDGLEEALEIIDKYKAESEDAK